ncbi:YcjF family protein [Pseudorhodoplanes sinuspersici]|uniref:TIGR01620 family protein n=1 Tax=Pseudorhodoplanes sinuspersici TaxID=1235591 RepID=A0A1W6ZW63_9HYPH|nr:TIGR01620 family protein [Pseudorhodoplanes sinuspersici]ARQ01612.1 TIGR01620 family protein [Pseudorhodoplanes sinuspersici]RKE73326.1 putative membrane protein [Pseudorhodoplanes sinuspersici]
MSSPRPRKPAIFSPDDPNVVMTAPKDDPLLDIASGTEADQQLPALASATKSKRRVPWRKILFGAVGGLISLGIGLAVTRLIEDLFARFELLGWVALVLAGLGLLALLAIIIRELAGLSRLATIEKLRERATQTLLNDNRTEGQAIMRDLLAIESKAPHLARSRTKLQAHLGEIIDGADLIRLAERELMTPLDREARQLVSNAAKRVSIVTAVSPRAAIDIFFVLITALGLCRQLALLYGGRPGTLGLFRLMRHVIAHLTITGGMAAGDSLIQQVIGHGLAAKLSARLGEGVLNGLLTARLGIAAIEVTRPLPFAALPRPTLTEVAGGIIRSAEQAEKNKA